MDLSSNSLLDIQFFGSVVPLRNIDHPGLVVHHADLVLSLIGDVIHLLLDVINQLGDVDNLGAIIQLFVVSPACFSIFTGVSGNSRSRPFPRMKASDSRYSTIFSSLIHQTEQS